jgi:hypothetical protein
LLTKIEKMVKAVERIEQELAKIEQAIADLATEFHSAYFQYLTLLGQAVKQQLIQSAYKVCTQGYPESFLALSLVKRQNLQQALRKLGTKAQEQLLSDLELPKIFSETSLNYETEETVDQPPVKTEKRPQDDFAKLFDLAVGLESFSPDYKDESPKKVLSKPEKLAKWIEQREKAIARTLETSSRETNRLLQKNQVIPEKLLAAMLEATSKADPTLQITTESAHILNFLMDGETEDDLEDSKTTRILSIHLRLLEIEFADPSVSAGRNQIRLLCAKLSTLQREYQKKRRELSVVKAETAWHSSWFED